MVDIKPFRGLRYHEATVVDLGRVVCPPYDVISSQEHKVLLDRSIYNAIRLELPEEPAKTLVKGDLSGRARDQLRQWLEENVLDRDEQPAFYVMAHAFTHRGKRFLRHELTACVRLEDFGAGMVKPHEHTEEGPIEKRLSLLKTLQLNVSPVMGLYDDPYGTIPRLLSRARSGPASLSFTLPEGDSYDLWMITDEEEIDNICSAFGPLPLYIADGHHRYAAALRYRDFCRQQPQSSTASAPFEFIMMSLIDMRDHDLLALPYHRALRGLSVESIAGLKKSLEGFFRLESGPFDAGAVSLQFDMAASSRSEQIVMAVVGLEEGKMVTLRPKSKQASDRLMAVEQSEAWRSLPPSIFREGVLRSIMELEEEQAVATGQLAYVKDATETVEMVLRKEYQLGFLLKPVPLSTLKRVADNGELLPPKSTFFYPKLPTGLVFYSLD